MVTTTVTTPYAPAMAFAQGTLDTAFSGEYDAQRLLSYDLYDDLYSSSPEAVSLMLRGTDDKPIFVPTAKRMINALSRYVGKDWGFAASPVASDVSAEQGADPTGAAGVDSTAYTAALDAMQALFDREQLLAVFSSSKKAWLRRGDWCWFVTANPLKAQGSRLTVRVIDPRSFHALTRDATDPYRVTAQQIVEETLYNETLAYDVQTWYRAGDPEYTGEGENITYEHVIWDQKDYSDPKKRKVLEEVTKVAEVPNITSLPVYHIRNNWDPENPYGISDLSGLESVVAGINQAVSDEDLSLSLTGLGMYVTDSGAPVDANGQDTNWVLGPNQVVEVGEGRTFTRVSGITSVTPQQDHIKYLEDLVFRTVGLSDVALGTADAPEAGIALAMKLQPVADVASEKNILINSLMTQLLYDLATQWFPTYEGIDMSMVKFTSTTAHDLLPFDRDARFLELTSLFTAGAITVEYLHTKLREDFGYDIPLSEAADVATAAQKAAKDAQAAADPYGDRAGAELDGAEA